MPAAIAWACNPQAHISLNGTSFSPGQSITVYGSYFTASTPAKPVTVTVRGVGASKDVQTSGGGAFTVSGVFTAPSTPGSYTITASRPTGGFAAVSFQVVAPAQPSQPSGSSQQAPAQQQSQSQAPSRSFDEPAVARSEREPARSRERSSGGNRSTGNGSQGTTPTQTTAPAAPAQPVFSGSTAPATSTTTFATEPSTTGAAAPARARGDARERSANSGRATTPAAAAPSQQTAFSDVWSGFQPGRTASLTSAGAGAPDGGPGSALGWGIGLLALGLFGLVGGLAYTEARRRRVA